jgi:GNAT superfamily N-acetyltransferase
MGGAAWTALLHERGYRDVRRTFEMVIELGDEPPPGPTPPAGVALRTARDGEEAAVHATVKEAFADLWDFQPESDELFVHHMGGDRSLWFLAVTGDGIPGAAVCKLDAATRIGWVDMLAVRRPWRRRGIAVALLLWAFREFHARGVREVRLRVDGDSTTGALQLYERAGMRVVSSSLLLDRAL